MNGKQQPTISIIIPVCHEAERINHLVAHLRMIDTRRDCELIVVDGSADSGTIDVLDDNDVIKLRSRKGRARQMNAGAAAASGSILLFLHADTTLPREAIESIENALDADDTVGGAFRVRFDPDRFVYRVFAWIDSWRSRVTRIPYGDQAIFVRRDYFDQNGGFSDIPLMEDVDLMRRIRR
ncbi:MAG: TIGR04283 family arsenosugar biosynthesis glycosyltransferase, partial [Candidatus Latescibacterota bacterium]